jgi:hypothetical protein
LAIAIQDVIEAVNYLNLVAQETAIDISQVKLGTDHLNPAQNLKSASTYQIWLERMQIIFASMIGVKPYYMQLPYINEKGNERVRLDYDGTHIKIIPDSQLQN